METFYYAGITFVNLTPHSITVRQADGDSITIPASGSVARLDETRTPTEEIALSNGTAILTDRVQHGNVYVLTAQGEKLPFPHRCTDTVYIVSALVAQKMARGDVYAPGKLIRNDEGRVVACEGLTKAMTDTPEAMLEALRKIMLAADPSLEAGETPGAANHALNDIYRWAREQVAEK